MNPLVKIGRYEILIGSVLSIQLREPGYLARLWYGWRKQFPPATYNVFLQGGIILRFNDEERQRLAEERELHQAVLQVHGMVIGQQRNSGMR